MSTETPVRTTESRVTRREWYREAIIYRVLIGSFHDADGDGSGDLAGLVAKLDHLVWLGVTCLWLSPPYASPMRDGGYDVSDFRSVLPEYGDLDDVRCLIAEAHRRGLRVIADIVVNHTSEQHHWFQESRTDPDGPFGDFYVWRDTDTGYAGAPVIFADAEDSNWTFDAIRGQFYWHRFYTHQPDLNYDHPAVRAAMLDTLAFWLDLGLDGLRLDAVPYLFEEEGTACENLPRTHDFLHGVRRMMDERYPGRALMVDANLPAAETAAYFGDGGEGNLVLHPSLLPAFALALLRGTAAPIAELVAAMPPPPPGAQWCTYLRDHDELTFEGVGERDREFLCRRLGRHPRTRANVGLRRRLAPLLDNDVRRIAMVTALLLALPGAPVLYYGDEIGMGDNVWLDDRDGVRTPMQWTADRNAGFSGGNPNQVRPLVISDAVYGYQSVNVEAQLQAPASLLNQTRTLLHLRRRHPAFGDGDLTEVATGNPSVYAFTRVRAAPDGTRDVVLCVHNVAPSPQAAELDLAAFRHCLPVEMTGGVPFPYITERRYRITLSGYRFFWFSLESVKFPRTTL